MSKKNVFITIGVVAVIAAAAATAWYFYGNVKKSSDDKVYVEKVSTIMGLATGNQNRYSGVVEPQKTVQINPESERTVKDIFVKIGDLVEEGTPLFNYDTDELGMDLEQTKLEIENIDVEISNFKSQITELQAEKDAAAEGDKFEYTTQIQTIQTSIKQSEFDRESKKLELEKTQKKMDNSEVVSTIAGVVKTLTDPKAGENADGSSAAFMTIMATGDFRIKGSINEQNMGMITVGGQVLIRSRVDETKTWIGTVGSIDTGDPSGSSDSENGESFSSSDGGDSSGAQTSSDYPFYVTLESADGLMLGQHVLIEPDQGQTNVKEGVWLYASYIIQEEETAYVWADNGENKLEKRTVELGEYDESLDEYEIKTGLSSGDMIAWPIDGLYEGVITVTSMDEVDYNSDLYKNSTEMPMGTEMGTEAIFDDGTFGTEMMMDGTMGVDGGMRMDSIDQRETMDAQTAGEESLNTEVSE